MSLSLIWPFNVDLEEDGSWTNTGWRSYKDSQKSEAVKQNLRILLLTNPGEYTFDIDFGVGIQRLLFQPHNSIGSPIEKITWIEAQESFQTETQPSAVSRIQSQVAQYMPYINISSINIDTNRVDNNQIGIRIAYSISLNSYEKSNTMTEVLEFLISSG